MADEPTTTTPKTAINNLSDADQPGKNTASTGDAPKDTTVSGKSQEAVKSEDKAAAKSVAGERVGGVAETDPIKAANLVATAHEDRVAAARECGSQDPTKPGPRVRERGEDPNQDSFADNRIELGRAKQAANATQYAGQAEESGESFQVTEPREARSVAKTG